MQARRAHQTTVSSRGYLPYPLNPPYYVNRTEEYQERVFEYARNYFSPAEMDDLTRLELFFVPQEAERIKRNLRRKGDFEDELNAVHPGETPGNMMRRNRDAFLASSQGRGPLRVEDRHRPIPTVSEDPFQPNNLTDTDLDDFQWSRGEAGLPNRLNPANKPGQTARTYKSSSLLRRVELFVASMFVFDCAHGLLAHLHEEAISLTSHGTDADETLLKQIVRNVRGYSFRRMLPTKKNDDTRIDPALVPDDDPNSPMDIDTQGGVVVVPQQTGVEERTYRPMRGPLESTIEDFSEPFSSTELKQLQDEGWIARDGKIYSPTRFPSSLAVHIPGNHPDQRSRATNEGVMDPSRTMGIYPVSFLTNTTIADDACAARLIEHCSSETMDPEVFSWGMRRQVFMPLEVDVADIYRFGDLKIYDELHEALNSFSNGMFAGLSLRGLWADYLRPRLSQVVTQVPQNQLRPFTNVVKHIEIPAAPGEMRHTAGQAEVIRLYNKADDILRKIDDWFRLGGDFSKVSYEDYRAAKDPRAILGNAAHASGWGQRALGLSRCGPGYLPQYFTADPATNPSARRVERTILGADGRQYLNPEALVEKCAPLTHELGHGDVDTADDVRPTRRLRTFASQRRAARHGGRRDKKKK